jgi:hypothetical protein
MERKQWGISEGKETMINEENLNNGGQRGIFLDFAKKHKDVFN